MTFIFGALIFVVVAPLVGVFSYKKVSEIRNQRFLEIEAKKGDLEAQKFERIKEILADAVISGNAPAVEVLKPLVEAVADQLRGEKDLEKKQLEHEQKLAEIKAANEPQVKAIEAQNQSLEIYKIWDNRIKEMWSSNITLSTFVKGAEIVTEATQKMFPNFQLPAPPDPKMLTQGSEDDEEK